MRVAPLRETSADAEPEDPPEQVDFSSPSESEVRSQPSSSQVTEPSRVAPAPPPPPPSPYAVEGMDISLAVPGEPVINTQNKLEVGVIRPEPRPVPLTELGDPDEELPLDDIRETVAPTPPTAELTPLRETELPPERRAVTASNDISTDFDALQVPEVQATPPKTQTKPLVESPREVRLRTETLNRPLSAQANATPVETPNKSISLQSRPEPFEEPARPEARLRDIPQPEYTDYRLKPGDEIEISVWGEDMTKTLVVRPDGKISYPLANEIRVVGMTFEELKDILYERLSKYIINPKITIVGKSFSGNFVSILGAVKDPGRKVINQNERVLDVISKAKGLRYEDLGGSGGEVANLKQAYLSRGGSLVPVDFPGLIYEGDMTQNVPVMIGDFIYIPSSIGQPIYITGEVRRPHSLPFRGSPTLLDAVSSAQGFLSAADKTRICIVRGSLYKPEITLVNYNKILEGKVKNFNLEPGDIVHIPPTSLTKLERISTQILPFLDDILKADEIRDNVR